MPLPNPGMTFDPFDTLPASDLNKIVENIEALEDGSAPIASVSYADTDIANPFKFRVYRASAQNTANNAVGKIQFDTENFDTNNNFDTTTNFRYTAPVSGFYQLNASAGVTSGGTVSGFISIYKNGSELTRGSRNTPQSSSAFACTISDLVQLTAGDYVEVFWFSNTTTSLDVGSSTVWFSGHLVSNT